MKLKLFESENLNFRKQPIARKDSSNISMGEWENQEEINRDFRDLVAQELDNPVNIKFDGDGNKYIDLNHLSSEAFKCTDFSRMFTGDGWAPLDKNDNIDISGWDVSRGQNFLGMFSGCHNFNSDLSNWDVSNGVKFPWMFYDCHNFNSDLSKWDVSHGADFDGTFENCHNFNSDLSKWDVSQGKNFFGMFWACHNFNSDLSKWDVSDKALTGRMFEGCPIEENFKPKKLQK